MFGRKKKRDKDDLPPMPGGDDNLDAPLDGEGKFPPPENAFNEPATPTDGLDKPDFPSTPQMPPLNQDFSEPERPKPQIIQPQASPQMSGDRIEVVIAKLDSVRSMLEVLNQRITNIETKISQNERRW